MVCVGLICFYFVRVIEERESNINIVEFDLDFTPFLIETAQL